MISLICSSLPNISSCCRPPPNIACIWFSSALSHLITWATAHLLEHWTESTTQSTQLTQSFLEYWGEREKSKGMSSWCCIKDDYGEFHRFDVSTSHISKAILRGSDRDPSTHFMISANPIASSTPGIAKATSCIIPPIPPPFWSATPPSVLLPPLSDQSYLTWFDHLL